MDCSGSEEILESCSYAEESSFFSSWSHDYDVGIRCEFSRIVEMEACPPGKFSDTVGTSPCTDCEVGKFR